MSQHSKKKNLEQNQSKGSSSLGRVVASGARYAKADTELGFAYYHSMDLWEKLEMDLRHKIKRLKVKEKML